jgi:hypothetical protein
MLVQMLFSAFPAGWVPIVVIVVIALLPDSLRPHISLIN